MEATKSWFTSKAVWGGIITIVSTLAKGFGVDLSTEEQKIILASALSLVQAFGGLLAIYGRFKAIKRIK